MSKQDMAKPVEMCDQPTDQPSIHPFGYVNVYQVIDKMLYYNDDKNEYSNNNTTCSQLN